MPSYENLYIPAIDVKVGDIYRKSYGDMPVFEVYETRAGTVAICVEHPTLGQHAYHHRKATKVCVKRPLANP